MLFLLLCSCTCCVYVGCVITKRFAVMAKSARSKRLKRNRAAKRIKIVNPLERQKAAAKRDVMLMSLQEEERAQKLKEAIAQQVAEEKASGKHDAVMVDSEAMERKAQEIVARRERAKKLSSKMANDMDDEVEEPEVRCSLLISSLAVVQPKAAAPVKLTGTKAQMDKFAKKNKSKGLQWFPTNRRKARKLAKKFG